MGSGSRFRAKDLNKLLQEIGQTLDITFLEGYKACKTDRERFKLLSERDEVDDILNPIEPFFEGKSLEDSQKARLDGNKLFQQKKFDEALKKFNESVIAAPWTVKDGEENVLALAHGNRSAALFYLKQYQKCTEEIDEAIKHGYAKENEYKLYERRGKSYIHLKDKIGAKKSYELALEGLNHAKAKAEEIDKLRTIFTQKLEESEKIPEGASLVNKHIGCTNIPFLEKKSKKFPFACDAFDIEYKPECGRYGVAKRDIRVGEIITVEKPFTTVLYPENFKSHCQDCYRELMVPYPCSQCSAVVYCSPQCQQNGWDRYHKLECQFMGYLSLGWMGRIGHISLRLAVIMGCKKLLEFLEAVDQQDSGKTPETVGFDGNGVYRADYNSVYHLVPHTASRPVELNVEFTVMAMILLKVFREADYFPEDVDYHENRLTIGGVLLRHLQIIQCNGYGLEQVGLYPTTALLNHSCDPVTEFFFYGDIAVARAVKCIRAGEQINSEYGAVFHAMPKQDRQLRLQFGYFFECGCRACEEDWPLMKELPNLPPIFRCRGCGQGLPPMFDMAELAAMKTAKCKCGHDETIKQNLLLLGRSTKNNEKAAQKLIDEGKYEEAIPLLVSHMFLLEEILMSPWKDFYNCQALVKDCYNMILKKCLPPK